MLFGHVTLNATTMIITFSGGTGQLSTFSGSADVGVTDAGTAKGAGSMWPTSSRLAGESPRGPWA